MERRLGKGINALIPQQAPEAQERVVYVKINQIKPNSLQPRQNFDHQGLEELAQSIKEKGVIQPLLVRRRGDSYELIAGERRFRAACLLNMEEVPVITKDADDQQSLELSLIENVQREDLNPIEEARAYQYLIDKFNFTQEQVSVILGKARTTVANILRLLKLPKEIQDEISSGRLSFAHGRALLEIEDINRQRRLSQEIISKRLSVRELENLIKLQRPKISRQHLKRLPTVDPYLAVLEEELQHLLATKVRVNKRKKRGQILIEFYSNEDLERIVGKIRGGAA